jgi:membrane protease subunit (stomatin/prohibitin family)
MSLVDVIKWNATPKDFCYKSPITDIRLGSQLIVYPAQTAFFVKGGAIYDEFNQPGTYTIQSENIPVLNRVINLPFGKESPFQAEVWFVNQIAKINLKWGTQTPIPLEDPAYHILVSVRAYGQYGIKTIQPRLFLETLIGSMEEFTDSSIEDYFKGRLLTCLSTAISRKIALGQMSVFTINAYLTDISNACEEEIDRYFSKYGIKIVDFTIMSINIPPEDEGYQRLKAIKAAVAGVSVGGRDIYQMERSFDVLDKAAENEGAGANLIGMGFGLGIGSKGKGIAADSIDTDPEQIHPPIPEPKTYHVYLNGKKVGGNTREKIRKLFEEHQIDKDTLIWRPGMSRWCPISSVRELWDYLETPPEI